LTKTLKICQDQYNMKTFFTSFFQIGMVAINTYFITQLYWVGIFIVSALISLLWCYNVANVSVSTLNQKLTYSLGAGVGAITGLFLVKIIFN
jgi:hypothetical protein